jgi:hypothetical protein
MATGIQIYSKCILLQALSRTCYPGGEELRDSIVCTGLAGPKSMRNDQGQAHVRLDQRGTGEHVETSLSQRG